MAIAISLKEYLDSQHLAYDTVMHPHAESSQHNASAAHQPGDRVAKCVLLSDENGYLLAVLPATHRLLLSQLHKQLKRRVGLATEQEVADVFKDCAFGAVPPAGHCYQIDTIVVDDALMKQPDIFFEAGDHEHLVHMARDDFGKLLGDARHGQFSRHV